MLEAEVVRPSRILVIKDENLPTLLSDLTPPTLAFSSFFYVVFIPLVVCIDELIPLPITAATSSRIACFKALSISALFV